MENDPSQRKATKSYLQGLQSLPDNKWVHRVPKVTEIPHRYVLGEEGDNVPDNVIFLPKFPEPEPPDAAA